MQKQDPLSFHHNNQIFVWKDRGLTSQFFAVNVNYGYRRKNQDFVLLFEELTLVVDDNEDWKYLGIT